MKKALSILILLAVPAFAGMNYGTGALSSVRYGTNVLASVRFGTTLIWSDTAKYVFTNTSGMLVWLDRTNITAGAMGTWKDTLGVRDAIQTTNDYCPTGVVCSAGGYELRFDGIDDFYALPTTISTPTNDWLFVAVVNRPTTNETISPLGSSVNATRCPAVLTTASMLGTSWGSPTTWLGTYTNLGRFMFAVSSERIGETTNRIYRSFINAARISSVTGSYSAATVVNSVARRATSYGGGSIEDIRVWGNRGFSESDTTNVMLQINSSFGASKVW